eukprot:c29434_g1_i1 orf=421-594(+)
MTTIRTFLAVVAYHTWSVFQMDFKFAFLNGELRWEVNVDQPLGYEISRMARNGVLSG